jgi:hypothetical protein
MARRQSKKKKLKIYVKKNWPKAVSWLIGAIMGLVLAKACNMIWPDSPVIVKEQTDTVKFVHSISPLPEEPDSNMRKHIEQQLMNIDLLNKYEKQIKKRIQDNSIEPCKMVLGNPYPKSKGYTTKSSSSFCLIELRRNGPIIDIVFSFIRQDYADLINTLGVKISKKNSKDGYSYAVLDQNYEPQLGKKDMLVRMVDDIPSGEYTIEAGFILKEDRLNQYPAFYRQTFNFKK